MHACRLGPSGSSWLGAGSACLALGEDEAAEECLCEANVLNNRDARVWAQLAVICARRSRLDEAKQALEQATRLELSDGRMLRALAEAMLGSGMWKEAEACARRALALGDGPGAGHLHRYVGDALAEQRE